MREKYFSAKQRNWFCCSEKKDEQYYCIFIENIPDIVDESTIAAS